MGSLFQLRDFWYGSFPQEEFSPSSMVVGNLDNMDTFDVLAIGSFQGYLRILLPGQERGSMAPQDLLFEQKFSEPILQLACGAFLPEKGDKPKNLLAVLFPRRLVLLRVERLGMASTAGDPGSNHHMYYECTTHFETSFAHTVCNLTYGPFGRGGHDMVCVQSMDGQLSIVDHNKVICQRFFPADQFLLPGAFTYCWQRDTFLTSNSSMFLLCYDFSNIANSVGSETKETISDRHPDEDGTELSSFGTKITPAWAFNLGDDATDIRVCRLTRGLPHNDGNIVALCPYALYVLTLDGECLLMKRLDVEMCSLCPYPMPGIQADNILIGGLNGSIYVYSDTTLEWSATLERGAPLSIGVASLCGIQGMILVLTGDGTVSTNYLGTDPAEKPIQPLESRGTSYAAMSKELKFVEHAIRKLMEDGEDDTMAVGTQVSGGGHSTSIIPPSPGNAVAGKASLTVEAEGVSVATTPTPIGETVTSAADVPQPSGERAEISTATTATSSFPIRLTFGEVSSPSPSGGNGETGIILPLEVSFTRPFFHLETLHDVVLQVDVVDPIIVEPAHQVLPSLSVNDVLTVPLRVSAAPDKDKIIPSSLTLTAVAIFTGKRYDTWATRQSVQLPLTLVATSVAPVKNTSFTLQLNTNKSPPPSLRDLFSDLERHGTIAANVLSIHYLNGADATILVSKNAARFKLQGSTMEGLWLLTSELVRRLREHYDKEGDLIFSIPDEMPTDDFLAVIDTHAAIRKELRDAVASLDRAAQFLRAVQKRLLARFRDRTPNSADTMPVLFDESYTLLQAATEVVVVAKSRQRQACAMLNCCARLFFFWMQVKYTTAFDKMSSSVKGAGDKKGVSFAGASATKVVAAPPTTTKDLLRELFTCDISADDGVGWEEVTELALVQLLGIKARTVANRTVEVSLSTTSLKKYFTQLVEHVKAGNGF